MVALLAEGVDRNVVDNIYFAGPKQSPSSRRAWIEILKSICVCTKLVWSPSSRRAWIEILKSICVCTKLVCVALLAEGVDRNRLR